VIKAAKQTPGVGRYDTYHYDEKIIKPPRVNHKLTADTYNFLDESKYLGSLSPKFHDPINLEKIKKKTREAHIRAETEMEKKLIDRKWARDNSPSPSSYRSIECHDKTSKYDSTKIYK